jgi:hypothetical protein
VGFSILPVSNRAKHGIFIPRAQPAGSEHLFEQMARIGTGYFNIDPPTHYALAGYSYHVHNLGNSRPTVFRKTGDQISPRSRIFIPDWRKFNSIGVTMPDTGPE